MQRVLAALFLLGFVSIGPSALSAKGRTVRIVVKGGNLAAPLEITDSKVGEFGVWEGPGAGGNGAEQAEGLIIDWSKGIVDQIPDGLARYEVLFFTGCLEGEGCRTTVPQLSYMVTYAHGPFSRRGFVYLPGRQDKEFEVNRTMWHGHGFEGHWLRASGNWEDFIGPLLAKAKRANEAH